LSWRPGLLAANQFVLQFEPGYGLLSDSEPIPAGLTFAMGTFATGFHPTGKTWRAGKPTRGTFFHETCHSRS
jgi:hypothetical protein